MSNLGVHGGHAEEHGRPALDQRAEHRIGVEAGQRGDRSAREQGVGHSHEQAMGVVDGHGDDEMVALGPVPGLADAVQIGQDRRLGVDDALGAAGRPGGVEDRRSAYLIPVRRQAAVRLDSGDVGCLVDDQCRPGVAPHIVKLGGGGRGVDRHGDGRGDLAAKIGGGEVDGGFAAG